MNRNAENPKVRCVTLIKQMTDFRNLSQGHNGNILGLLIIILSYINEYIYV